MGGLVMSGHGPSFTCHRRAQTVTQVQTQMTTSQTQQTRRVIIERRIIRSNGVVQSETTQIQTSSDATLDSDETLTRAQMLYVSGDFEQAIAMAKTAQKDSPVRANRIIGSAACMTKNVKLVEESYKKLDAPSRQYLVYVCQRNGIGVRGNHFELSE